MREMTVVMTTYNLARHLPKRLEELRRQSFQDFDVLFVDDASTDGSRELIRAACEKDSVRFRALFAAENAGSPAATRNRALDSGMIDGRYTLFLDGDDALEPSMLQELHEKAARTDADITICGYDRVEIETGKVLCREMLGFPETVEHPAETDLPCFINTSPWNKLILTERIGDARFPAMRVGEDMIFLSRLYPNCKRIAFVDRVLIHYQVRSASVMSNTSLDSIHQFADEAEGLLRLVEATSFYETFSLTTFVHIGISMAIRASQNAGIQMKPFLRWEKEYLKRNRLLSGRRALRLRSLVRHGMKGVAIWGCKVLYCVNGMRLFLALFQWMTRVFRVDFRF